MNGDEPIATGAKLRQYYDRMMAHQDHDAQASLVVNQAGGDDIWSGSQVANLTYCVSTGFGSDYNVVVSAMQAGCGAVGGRLVGHRLHPRAIGGRELHDEQQLGAVLGRADLDHPVHRPRVLPQQR